MSMMDKLHSGELYLPGDDELQRKQLECLEKLDDFNMTRPSESEKRKNMLRGMFRPAWWRSAIRAACGDRSMNMTGNFISGIKGFPLKSQVKKTTV